MLLTSLTGIFQTHKYLVAPSMNISDEPEMNNYNNSANGAFAH